MVDVLQYIYRVGSTPTPRANLVHCTLIANMLYIIINFLLTFTKESIMAWTKPIITQICVGLEINSYASAEI